MKTLLIAAALTASLAAGAQAQVYSPRQAQQLPADVAQHSVVCFDYVPTGWNGSLNGICVRGTTSEFRQYLIDRAAAQGRQIAAQVPCDRKLGMTPMDRIDTRTDAQLEACKAQAIAANPVPAPSAAVADIFTQLGITHP